MNLQTLISDEVQLGLALTAFSNAHSLEKDWPIKYTIYLRNAGITSMAYLQQGCVQNTINLDLELFDIPITELLSDELIAKLRSFLPGPVGFRCFRLAQKAAEKVAYGTAQTEYVNRPANGKKGDEKWAINNNQSWTLNVDCAGFVRNCLKHVTKNPFRLLLSDRDFMRAKDFYGFFSSLPHTVLDTNFDYDYNNINNYHNVTNSHLHLQQQQQQQQQQQHDIPPVTTTTTTTNGTLHPFDTTDQRTTPNTMHWRRVPDLRMVIPGDVIVYRPKGNAAGGAAFTEYDRKDLSKLCKAVKAAQLYRIVKQEWDMNHLLVEPKNVMKDPSVQPWAIAVENKLNSIGIKTVKHLLIALMGLKKFKPTNGQSQQEHMGEVLNLHLKKAGFITLKYDTIQLMYECATTTALNTGHIVFAAGIAVDMGSNNEYRIRVVHSTKFGKKDINGVVTTGVQEHYRRFKLIQEKQINPQTGEMEIVREFWTRTPREVTTTTNTTTANTNNKQQEQLLLQSLLNNTKSDCGSINDVQSMTSNVSITNDNNTVQTEDTTTNATNTNINSNNNNNNNTPQEIIINHHHHHNNNNGTISEDDVDDANDDMEEEEMDNHNTNISNDMNNATSSTSATTTVHTTSTTTNGSIEILPTPATTTTTSATGNIGSDLNHTTLTTEAKPVDDIDQNKNDTVDDNDDDDDDDALLLNLIPSMKPTDELSGQSEIIVVAARMCF
jgi:hypothetical protein